MIRIKKNIFVQKKAFFKRLNFPLTVIILALAVFFIFPKRARSATIQEIFIMLPEERVMNLSPVDRRALIDKSGQGASGYTPPDERGFWVEIHGIHSLTLFSIRDAPINFKVFSSSKGWQLLAICRSRQTYGPANANETPHETFLDLILYSVSLSNDLIKVDLADYLPPISVYDFMTSDTVIDKKAVRDLQAIDSLFGDCLTCHSSVEDSSTIDIVTVTSINGHSCANLMPQFKLLPLRWLGDHFTKPYDRAALPIQDRPKTEPQHGIYYHEPGK